MGRGARLCFRRSLHHGANLAVGARRLDEQRLQSLVVLILVCRILERHDVPPGITGLAQVRGRNGLTWERKFRLDTWYVDHWSLSLDMWILWRTIVSVLRRDGISAPGHASMPEFLGSTARGKEPARQSSSSRALV